MDKPIAEFLAGTNGAGKSSLRGDNLRFKVIDPDAIAKQLNPRSPSSVSLQAGKVAIKLFNECLKTKTSFTMETTLTGKSSINRIREAKEAGFYISLKFIGLTSPDINVDRVRERVKAGGHHIEESTIRARYDESIKNLEQVLHLADKIAIYDNSIKNKNHKLFTIVKNNSAYNRINPPLWIEKINKKIDLIL